jgi:hypothetical protein
MAFCINCGQYVSYSIATSQKEVEVRGKTFIYNKHFAICNKCGKEIYVPEINDINVETIKECYKRC